MLILVLQGNERDSCARHTNEVHDRVDFRIANAGNESAAVSRPGPPATPGLCPGLLSPFIIIIFNNAGVL